MNFLDVCEQDRNLRKSFNKSMESLVAYEERESNINAVLGNINKAHRERLISPQERLEDLEIERQKNLAATFGRCDRSTGLPGDMFVAGNSDEAAALRRMIESGNTPIRN